MLWPILSCLFLVAIYCQLFIVKGVSVGETLIPVSLELDCCILYGPQ